MAGTEISRHRSSGTEKIKREFSMHSSAIADSICICLVLMRLPIWMLTALYLIYIRRAIRRFHGQSATFSLSHPGFGGPLNSFPVSFIMDALLAGFIAFLLPQSRVFILELAPIVVAVSAGGGGVYGGAACSVLFVAVHLSRRHAGPQLALNLIEAPLAYIPPLSGLKFRRILWLQRAFLQLKPLIHMLTNLLAIQVVGIGIGRPFRAWFVHISAEPLAKLSAASSLQDMCAGKWKPTPELHSLCKALAQSLLHLRQTGAEAALAFASSHHQNCGLCYLSSRGPCLSDIGAHHVTIDWQLCVGTLDKTFSLDQFLDTLSIRVDGMLWTQTQVAQLSNSQTGSDMRPYLQMTINDLLPGTEYEVAIVDRLYHEKRPFFHTDICTLQVSPSSGKTAQLPADTPSAKPSRISPPDSPLKETINSLSTKSKEKRAYLKRLKRDQNRKIAAIKSEIEGVRNKMKSKSKDDERAKRTILSLKESVRRTEEKIQQTEKNRSQLEAQREELREKWVAHGKRWSVRKNVLEREIHKKESHKKTIEQSIVQYKADQALNESRRDKLQARTGKLRAELESAESQARSIREREIKTRERTRDKRIQALQEQENQRQQEILQLEISIRELVDRTARIWEETLELRGLNNQPHRHQMLRPPNYASLTSLADRNKGHS